MIGDDQERPRGEIISFEDASHPHVHARKEEKLKKVRKAFRAATKEIFGNRAKDERTKNRRRKKGKKKK